MFNFSKNKIYLHGSKISKLNDNRLKRFSKSDYDAGGLFFTDDTLDDLKYCLGYSSEQGGIFKVKINLNEDEIFDIKKIKHMKLVNKHPYYKELINTISGYPDWGNFSILEDALNVDEDGNNPYNFKGYIFHERSKGFNNFKKNILSLCILDDSVIEIVDFIPYLQAINILNMNNLKIIESNNISVLVDNAYENLKNKKLNSYIDAFTGLKDTTIIKKYYEPKILENALKNRNIFNEIKTLIKPCIDNLKQKGNTIKLYRKQELYPKTISERKLLSWSSDKEYVEKHNSFLEKVKLLSSDDIEYIINQFELNGEVYYRNYKLISDGDFIDIFIENNNKEYKDIVSVIREDEIEDFIYEEEENYEEHNKLINKDFVLYEENIDLDYVIWISKIHNHYEFIVINDHNKSWYIDIYGNKN